MLKAFRNPTNHEISNFLIRQGPFDLAVTVNLKKRHPNYHINNSPEIAEKTGRWFIGRLNENLLRRKYRYKHSQLRTVCSVEKGLVERRLHLHLAIGMPPHINKAEFIKTIIKIHKKMDWAYGEIHIAPYINDGWIDYLQKEGFESVLL